VKIWIDSSIHRYSRSAERYLVATVIKEESWVARAASIYMRALRPTHAGAPRDDSPVLVAGGGPCNRRKRSPKPQPATFRCRVALRREARVSRLPLYFESGRSLSREFSTVCANSRGYVVDHRPDAADVVGVGMGYQPIAAREADTGQQSP
jgi:hypothetical protein